MFLLLTLATGCDLLDDIQDDVDGYTTPLVVQAIVLGVAEPGQDLDLGGTDFADGTVATVMGADAQDAASMGDAPVTNADVTALGQALEEQEGGTYTGQGMTYTPGGEGVVKIVRADGSTGTATMTLPGPPAADVPEFHDGSPLLVDLSGQDYDRLVVVVLDVTSGDVTFTNVPEDIEALYDFATADEISLTIPASAFAGSGFYAVGLAGLQNGDPDTFEGFNTALSDVQAGQLKFWPLTTEDIPN
jgi:hypothetical protein